MPPSIERYPFYYRTQQQYEAVRKWTITLRCPSKDHSSLIDLRAELRSKTHDASKNFVNVPESVPGDKKYIGVLRVPTRLLRVITVNGSIPEILQSFGVEPIIATSPTETKIKDPVIAVFNVRNQKSLSKLASQLDKKIGTGNWRFRGTRNFRKKLDLIEKGSSSFRSRKGLRLPQVLSTGGNTPKEDPYVEKLRRTGVDVTVMVDASFGLTKKEIEKMIFKAILST